MISYDSSEIINVGTGEDLTIKELVELISIIVGYRGEIKWDTSKPNGTPRKVLNVDKIKTLGWSPKIGIRQGIYDTYEWYKENACE
jgi:GDP-L-fucose synthase